MRVRLDVAAKPPTAAPSSAEFLRGYPATPCFTAVAREGDRSGVAITTLGADPAAFERFGAAFRDAVKLEPDLQGMVVRSSQCPAVDFLQSANASTSNPPRLVLDNALVGEGHPLSGAVVGLAGRQAVLLVVDDDGAVFRLRTQSSANGDSATFVANVRGDPTSIDKPEMLIAVASDRPLVIDEKIAGAASAELMPKLAAESRQAGAAAAFTLFKFME